jgi:hypothetical protein
MHLQIKQENPGFCSICGMSLTKEENLTNASQKDDYTPLLVVFGVIALVMIILGYRDSLLGIFSWHMLMMYFMAGMFLVFSTFKLLDLKGFKEGYMTYDLIARQFPLWGYIYPFVELTLGLLYLVGISTLGLNLFVFILMAINGLGVVIKLAKKEKFQCACLGTFLKVPLTKISLIEDFGMALMVLYMIL